MWEDQYISAAPNRIRDYDEGAVIRAPQPDEAGWDPMAALRDLIYRQSNPEPEISNESIYPKKQYVNPLQPLMPTLTKLIEGEPVQDRSQILPEMLGFMPGAGAAKGAAPVQTELSELLPVIAHSLKQRRALAEAVPEYSQVVEGLGGVTENAGRMIKEGATNLWNRIKGAIPEVEPAGEFAFAPARIEKQTGGGGYTDLISMRGEPEKEMGRLTYRARRGESPPSFSSIQADHPRAVAELLRGIEQDLGPDLNNMVLSQMLPEAVPFWESALKSKHLAPYPGLRKNMERMINFVKQDEYIPKSSYGYARGGPAMETAVETTSAPAYRPFLHGLLGKHGVIIPRIPQSTEEPLLLKTTAPTINELYERIINPSHSRLDLPATGVYSPLWGTPLFKGPRVNLQREVSSFGPEHVLAKQGKLSGDVVLSSTQTQDRTIPHEFTHYLDDLLTEEWSRGKRPIELAEKAATRYYKGDVPAVPGQDYENASSELWSRLGKEHREALRARWGGMGDRSMSRELIAELTNPRSLAERLNKSDRAAWGLRAKAELHYPELQHFWEMVPDYIPENAYYVPQMNVPQAAAGIPSLTMPLFE